VRPLQPPIRRLRVKWLGGKSLIPLPPSTKIRTVWSHTSIPTTSATSSSKVNQQKQDSSYFSFTHYVTQSHKRTRDIVVLPNVYLRLMIYIFLCK